MTMRAILAAVLAFIRPMADAILAQVKGKRGAELRLGMQVVTMLSDIGPSIERAFSEASPGGKNLTLAETRAIIVAVRDQLSGIVSTLDEYET